MSHYLEGEDVFNYLSDDLLSKSVKIYTGELAWKYTDVIEVMNSLAENNLIILGGDVLNQDFTHTYDNWHCDYDESVTFEKNIDVSLNKSIQYAEAYHTKFGDSFYYVVVCTTKENFNVLK